MARSQLETRDGRLLEYTDSRDGDRGTMVFHAGTPDGLVAFAPLATEASAQGLRIVSVARPGYECSTRHVGRAVADVVADVEDVLDHVGAEEYVAVGYSGGGPHALACRALSAERCLGAVVVSSLAPCGAAGLDFLDGMSEENARGFRKAIEGPAALEPYLESLAPAYAEIQSSEVVEALNSTLPEVDRAHLSVELAAFVAEALRRGVGAGIGGWLDDTLAFTRPWGFDVHDLTRVAIWHGTEDLMVPCQHGHWLARACQRLTPTYWRTRVTCHYSQARCPPSCTQLRTTPRWMTAGPEVCRAISPESSCALDRAGIEPRRPSAGCTRPRLTC